MQVEPHLSVTGACSAEWVPIRPKTDAAFLYALIYVLLHEEPRSRLDLEFSIATPPRRISSARTATTCAIRYGQPIIAGSLEAKETHVALEIGPTATCSPKAGSKARTAFAKLLAHMKPYSPEWAQAICDARGDHPAYRSRISPRSPCRRNDRD